MWNWLAGDKLAPSATKTNSQTAFQANTAPGPAPQQAAPSHTGYNQVQGYPQPQNAGNFFYGYQGTFQSGYQSYPEVPAAHHIRYNPAYQTEPYFIPKPKPVSAVSEVRRTDKSLKRKRAKHPSKPPILRRKERINTDTSQSSSPYQATSSQSPSPRSVSPASGDSNLGGPDFAQESVLGRASILVLDDYRSSGHQSIGSRSTKSRTSTSALREYRPSHIPDPVVPGFSFTSDDDDHSPDKQSDAGSDDGRGYTRSIETTSVRSASKNLLISPEHPDDDVTDASLKQRVPTPPPILLPPQPLYATVNKDNKPKKPKIEDPIYSTIEEAKKNHAMKHVSSSVLTKASASDSQPLTLLGELKQRFSLRSKAKALEFGESSDLPANSPSYQSAFRPYNALKASTYKMDDDHDQVTYDMPIPIDKVLLKDGSEPSDISDDKESSEQVQESTGVTPAFPGVDDDNRSDLPNKAEDLFADASKDVELNGSEHAKETETSPVGDEPFTGAIEKQISPEIAADDDAAMGKPKDGGTSETAGANIQTALSPMAPRTQDQGSLISSVHTQSNITQSSYKSSQLPPLHEPITAPDFQPKGILKHKKALGESSSSSSSSSEESEDEEEKEEKQTNIDDNEKYHLKIPVEGPGETNEIEPEVEKELSKRNVAEEATSPGGLAAAHKYESNTSLHSSLRAARKAALVSEEINLGSARRNVGVSFTADTKDNEGLAKKYEKEGLDISKAHKERASSRDIFAHPIPIFDSKKEDEIPKPVSYPKVEETKAIEPIKEPEETKQASSTTTKPKPETKDQSVSTDAEPLDVIVPAHAPLRNTIPSTEPEKRKPTYTEPKNIVESTEPDKRNDYALVMKSPRGILKHPNGTATLQLNQPNQFVISTPDKCATLPNGSLTINTDLIGTHRSGGYSPTFKLVNQSPSYTVRHTGDNISVVSISGYDPAFETRSNYSMDTIRTLDDFKTGTIRTMVSLGTYSNPYMGNELVGNDSAHYRRQISETSTDPLAFSMSYDSRMFDYQLQNKQNGNIQLVPPRNKKREAPVPKTQMRSLNNSKSVQKKTTFADHALGYDALFRKEKSKKRKRRCVKIVAILLVLAVVIVTVSLVIFFLTDKDNQQDSADQ